MTACEHQWEWTQPRIVIIGDPLGLAPNGLDTYNARCKLCGELVWAHGWNVPVPVHPGPRDPVLEQEC